MQSDDRRMHLFIRSHDQPVLVSTNKYNLSRLAAQCVWPRKPITCYVLRRRTFICISLQFNYDNSRQFSHYRLLYLRVVDGKVISVQFELDIMAIMRLATS